MFKEIKSLITEAVEGLKEGWQDGKRLIKDSQIDESYRPSNPVYPEPKGPPPTKTSLREAISYARESVKNAPEEIKKVHERNDRLRELTKLTEDFGGYEELDDQLKEMSKLSMIKNPFSINEWCEASYAVAKEKGWHDPAKPFTECILLAHAELSEAVEEYRNHKRYDEIYVNMPDGTTQEYNETLHKGMKVEGIAVEIADNFIRLFDTCKQYDIPLERALRIKHAYNMTRSNRHGGKKI